MYLAIFLLIIGLVVLILGAEALVRGSASLASKMGISPLVIGLTVVAFGTSAPELIVNMFSALKGSADIAIGNVIGSNIANILLILGISAIIVPLTVKGSTVWKEIPFALLAVIMVFIMGNDAIFDGASFNAITRTDGLSLISFFAIFMIYIFGIAKTSGESEKIKTYSYPISITFTFIGLVLLFVGGKVLVDNAVILAKLAGMSEALIGLTIVAVGTSLPELATCVVAALRGHNDIAIGNVVGSNIFNVFWVLGLTATMLQLPFNPDASLDVLVAVIAAFLLFMAMFTGKKHRIDRWQGVLFVIMYMVYIAYLLKRG
ncbi:MAG: calcium/sodium antiporter [Candidatus Gracilibacteria bacterium]|nr:calcium/sodium antiporter [Candidatus Gracilibacteria bacterium]